MNERDVLYEIAGQRFVCDKAKAKSNLEKHGTLFEEAASVFAIDEQETFIDEEHSHDEERLIVMLFDTHAFAAYFAANSFHLFCVPKSIGYRT